MEEELRVKIERIREILDDQNILKATDFDQANQEANIEDDPKGAQWNRHVHAHCCEYGFEIWKDDSGHNWYVNATENGRNEAINNGLHPDTTCN